MHTRFRPSPRRGFTLIELLTVIAIIGILAAILIPTVGAVRQQAKRTQCVSNVRQITALLLNMASQDKQQRFPSIKAAANQPVGAGPWDVERERKPGTPANQLTLDDLAKNAGSRVMYCPGANIPEGVDPYRQYSYAAISYILLVGAPYMGPNEIKENIPNMYHSDRIRSEYKTFNIASNGYITIPASQRELVVDALGIQGSSWAARTTNLGIPYTNHVSGKDGAGVNVGFVDGHVAWRSLGEIIKRSGTTARTGTGFQNTAFVW